MPEHFVEVSHEALIRAWPRLRQWLDGDRAALRLHARIGEASKEWEASGRDDSFLFRGPRLAEAQVWRIRRESELNSLERAFLDASVKFSQRLEDEAVRQREKELDAARKLAEAERQRADGELRARRRQRAFSYGLAGLVVITAWVAALAYLQSLKADAAARAERKSAVAASVARDEARERVADLFEEAGSRLLNERNDPERALVYLSEALKNTRNRPSLTFLTSRALAPLNASIGAFEGHTESVTRVSFDRNGGRLVSAGVDGTAKVWDTGMHRLLFSLDKHDASVSGALFCPDGKSIATASTDGAVHLWAASDGHKLRLLKAHTGRVNFLSFLQEGSRIVTVAADGRALVWNVASGEIEKELPNDSGPLWVAAIDRSGRYLFAGSDQGVASVWDLQTGAKIRTFTHASGQLITAAGFDPAGATAFTAAADGSLKLWDLRTGDCRSTLSALTDGGSPAPVSAATFSPDGKVLLTATGGGQLKLWRASDGKMLSQVQTTAIHQAIFTADGGTVITAQASGEVNVWTGESSSPVARLALHTGDVLDLALAADGRHLATCGRDASIRLWDLAALRLPVVFNQRNGPLTAFASSADGTVVATGSEDNTVQLWDTARGIPLGGGLPQNGQWAVDLAFSHDGAMLVTTTINEAKLWKVSDQTPIELPGGARLTVDAVLEGWQVKPEERRLKSAIFTPDGGIILASSAGVWKRWNLHSGEAIARNGPPIHPLASIALFPKGDLLLGLGGGQESTWKAWNGQQTQNSGGIEYARIGHRGDLLALGKRSGGLEVYSPEGAFRNRFSGGPSTRITGLVFSPDDRFLLSTNADKSVATLWDTATGARVALLVGHTATLSCSAVHPTGAFFATGDAAGIVKLWDTKAGREIASLKAHGAKVRNLVFLGDGSRLLTSGQDGSVKVWVLDFQERAVPEEIIARINSEIPFHLEENRVLPKSLVEASLGYALGGRPLAHFDPVRDAEAGFLAESARSKLVDGDPIAAAAYAVTARMQGADWFAETIVANAALASFEGVLKQFDRHTASINRFAVSPDQRYYATSGSDGMAWIYEFANSSPKQQLQGHSSMVLGLSFSPTVAQLVTTSRDGTSRIWDIDTGREVRRLDHDSVRQAEIKEGKITGALARERQINDAIYSPDGNTIITGADDGCVRVWSANSGQYLRTLLQNPVGVVSLLFNPASGQIAVGLRDDSLKLIRFDDGREIPLAQAVALDRGFSPNGELLAAWDGGKVRLWKTADGSSLGEFTDANGIFSFAFSPDSSRLLLGEQKKAALVDLASNRVLFELQADGGFVRSAVFSADGRQIATVGDDRKVRLWNVSDQALLACFAGAPSYNQLRFSPDGRQLLVYGRDCVRVLDTAARCFIERQDKLPKGVVATALQGGAGGLRAIGVERGVAKILDPVTGASIAQCQPRPAFFGQGGSASIHSIVILPVKDITRQLNHSTDPAIVRDVFERPVDTMTPALVTAFDGELFKSLGKIEGLVVKQESRPTLRQSEEDTDPETPLQVGQRQKVDAALSVEIARLVAKEKWRDEFSVTANLYDSRNGGLLWRNSRVLKFEDAHQVVEEMADSLANANLPIVAVDQGGDLLATGNSDGLMELWDVRTGDLKRTFEPVHKPIRKLCFSPDGSILACVLDDALLVATLANGEVRLLMRPDSPVTAIALSSDNKLFALGDRAGNTAIGRLDDGSSVARCSGHRGEIKSISFSPAANRWLLTRSEDGSARLWSVQDGTLSASLVSASEIRAAEFASGDQLVITGAENGIVSVWDVLSGKTLVNYWFHRAPVLFVNAGSQPGTLFTADRDGSVCRRPLSFEKPLSEFLDRTLRDNLADTLQRLSLTPKNVKP